MDARARVRHHLPAQGKVAMNDIIYIAGTILFFAAMLTYVRTCAALGGAAEEPEASHER
jgi:hypothetical protein